MTITTDYRTVVILKHFLGCSYVEISDILEIPEKTVKSRLYTARQQLRDALSGLN
jgi:RNA polymerase sigma-70 factor (ECF subfamily)